LRLIEDGKWIGLRLALIASLAILLSVSLPPMHQCGIQNKDTSHPFLMAMLMHCLML